jgi:hypothetical protein
MPKSERSEAEGHDPGGAPLCASASAQNKKLKSQAELPWHHTYVNPEEVKAIVDLVPHVAEHGPECQEFASIMTKEFHACENKGVIRKLVLVDHALMIMTHTLCKDTGTGRCTTFPDVTASSTIVQPILLPDERVAFDCVSGVKRMLRPGRDFKVNDPLAFNLILRQLQRHHPSWPIRGANARGTKGITDALDYVGLGPGLHVRGQRVTTDPSLRGLRDTDPQVRHPDGPRTSRPTGNRQRETDGLYYREYTFDKDRCEMASSRQKHGTPCVVVDFAPVP